MMKKLCLLIVFNFTLSVCCAKHFNKLEISYSEFRPNFSIQTMNNMFEVCDVKIYIKNVSNSPVFFGLGIVIGIQILDFPITIFI